MIIEHTDKVLLVEPIHKSISYNLALLKFARYCKNNNIQYEYIRGCIKADMIPTKILMSCIFSYYSKRYDATIDFYTKLYPNAIFIIGGIFPTIVPEYFDKYNGFFSKKIEIVKGQCNLIQDLVPLYDCNVKDEEISKRKGKRAKKLENKKNLFVYHSSRGCVNKCQYCAVPKIEGDLVGKDSIQNAITFAKTELNDCNKIILLDNNFIANPHYSKIIDELVEEKLSVDLVSGTEMKLFTDEVAKNISKLTFCTQSGEANMPLLRFAFDRKGDEKYLERTIQLIQKYKIKAYPFLYMLYNFNDTPREIYDRICFCSDISVKYKQTIFIFPQRYEPLNTLEIHKHTSKNWTNEQVRGFKLLATFLRGFIPTTASKNIFKWIGHTYEEFENKITEIANGKKIAKDM